MINIHLCCDLSFTILYYAYFKLFIFHPRHLIAPKNMLGSGQATQMALGGVLPITKKARCDAFTDFQVCKEVGCRTCVLCGRNRFTTLVLKLNHFPTEIRTSVKCLFLIQMFELVRVILFQSSNVFFFPFCFCSTVTQSISSRWCRRWRGLSRSPWPNSMPS